VGLGSPIPLAVVSALAQDHSGFVWVGTTAGLVRYDGYQFRQPRSSASQGRSAQSLGFVRSLLVARDGRLWIGTEADGLAAYDPVSERLSLLGPRQADGRPLSAGTIRALAQDRDGSLWVGTTGHGLARYDPATDRFQPHRQADGLGLPDDRVQSLLVDRQGSLWVGTWQGLARRRAGSDRFEPVFSSPGQPGLAGKIVQSLYESPDGLIWAGTQQGDLALIHPDHGLGGSVNTFVASDAQSLWVGRNGGLELRRLPDGALLQRLRHDPLQPGSLAGNEVRALLLDRAGWIWTGGYGGGLQRHNPANTSIWVRGRDSGPQALLQDPSTRSLLQLDNGEVWLGGNDSGITILNERLESIAAIRPDPGRGLAGGRISSMVQLGDGTVWVGSDAGLQQLSRERRLLRVMQLDAGRARRLLAGRDGTLWVATQDGLYRLPPGASRIERLAGEDGQPLRGDVNALVEATDASLWVGTEKGLYRLAAGAQRLLPVVAAAGKGLAHHSIVGLLLDRRQRLWVDSASGLHLMTHWDGREARFDRISERHGVLSRAFGANLLEDEQGRIWTQNFVYDPARDVHYELTAADGVDIGTGWFRSYLKTRDGRLLFGASKGVLVVTPQRFQPWAYQPPLVITELRVDGQRVSAGGLQQGLSLAAAQRGFSLEFASLDFSDPDRNRYAYRLEGFDPDWISTGADLRLASYSNLDPGHYVLQVRGSNRSGAWSPQELRLEVTVLPAWWQTWWARAAGLAVLAALVTLLVQLRTAYLRRQHAALERMVGERTAELEALSQALQLKSAALEESSLSDPLTGLRNRRFLTQHIEADVALSLRRHEEARQRGLPPPEDGDLIFFLLDLDHFKSVNDRFGHSAGDRLQPIFREADYLVRWGGEEFLIVARATSRRHGAELAERARAMVAGQPFELGEGRRLHLSASVGFAAFPLQPAAPRALGWASSLSLADAALYAVKGSGRDGWQGVLAAREQEATALQQRAAAPAADWLASGTLEMQASR
jgi:diguanylate cyclase (GGDEF)-like protein